MPAEHCVHEITAHFKVSDMMQDCDVRTNPNCWGDTKQYNGINLIYAAGHCHAPSCIRKVSELKLNQNLPSRA